MKTAGLLLRLLPWLALIVAPLPAAESSASFAYEADAPALSAVQVADDERIAASISADRERLAGVLADELRYAHSNGSVDTKASYIDSIVERRSVYESYEYRDREFFPVAPGVVLMTGRALIGSRNADGPVQLDLNFLAVWRQENGQWRFLAWQSCRNPAPTAAE